MPKFVYEKSHPGGCDPLNGLVLVDTVDFTTREEWRIGRNVGAVLGQIFPDFERKSKWLDKKVPSRLNMEGLFFILIGNLVAYLGQATD